MRKEIVVFALACLLCMPAWAKQEKKHNLEIAYEHSSYTYKEPHMEKKVKDSGSKNGVSMRYTMRSLLSSEFDEADPSFAMLDLRYMRGDVKYEGWMGYTDFNTGEEWSEPYSQSGLDDYYFEAALKAGRILTLGTDRLELWPYLGIGWRQLTNHADELTGGYKRTQTYVYIPIGTDFKWKVDDRFSLTLNGQFDWLIHGNNHNDGVLSPDLSEVESISMGQDQGYGLRLSVRADIEAGKVGFFVEPFWRYWHIQNSEEFWLYWGGDPSQPAICFVEPFNTTREYGLRVGITF